MKHFYQKIDKWFDFSDIYKNAVINAKENSHFVEIGVWKGGSTSFMGVEIYNSKKNIRFDAIDNFSGVYGYATKNDELYECAKSNLKPLIEIGVVNLIYSSSIKASLGYKENTIDFCFIDGNHDYDSVKSDILNWLPKIKKGGIIAGHDFIKNFGGVVQAVEEVFSEFEIIGTSWLKRL